MTDMEPEDSNWEFEDFYWALEDNTETWKPRERPLLLSILCIIFFVQSVLLSSLFLASAFYNSWLTKAINNYTEGHDYEKIPVLLFTIGGFALHGLLFIGTYYIWQLKKKGLVIIFISVFFILLFTFIIGAGSILNYLVYIMLLILIYLFHNRLQ